MTATELEYLKLFKDVCKSINSSLNFGEVLKSITENTVRMLNVKGCAIFLLDEKQKRLNISASYGLSEAYIGKGPIDAEKSIAECMGGKQVLVADAADDPRIQYAQEAKREGIVSILSVPLSIKERIIGVLRIYTSKPREFSDVDQEFISGLAEIGSIGIENARMYHHLQADHEKLLRDVHQWFEFGRTS